MPTKIKLRAFESHCMHTHMEFFCMKTLAEGAGDQKMSSGKCESVSEQYSMKIDEQSKC